MTSEPKVKILELLAEGGSLTVMGQRTGVSWRYAIIVDETALAEEGGGVNEMPLATWDEVIAKLERYHWRKLHTHFVHPEFAERIQAAREVGPPIHEVYLPHSSERLARHFVRLSPDRRQLRYYEDSARRYRDHMASAANKSDRSSFQDLRLPRQIEKDERFWTVSAFMALYHSDDRIRMFAELLELAFHSSRPPIDLKSWRECLEGDLRLYFEADLPSPRAYRDELRKRRATGHPIPYVRELASRISERALEGPTQVDALLVNPANGFAVFFESKVLSDTSCQVFFDPMRNQIARSIDVMLETPPSSSAAPDSNAAAVAKRDPARSLFVLLTPQIFYDRPDSRLYGWLMNEYRNNPDALGRDLPHRHTDWRAVSKRLGWTTFEEINRIRPGACGWDSRGDQGPIPYRNHLSRSQD